MHILRPIIYVFVLSILTSCGVRGKLHLPESPSSPKAAEETSSSVAP